MRAWRNSLSDPSVAARLVADEFFDDVDDADAPATALESSASTSSSGGSGKSGTTSRLPPLFGSGGASDEA